MPARAMADTVMDYWVNFMRTGKPVASGRPEWSAFDLDRRSVMVFGNQAIAIKPAPPSQPGETRPSRRAADRQEPWQRLRESSTQPQ